MLRGSDHQRSGASSREGKANENGARTNVTLSDQQRTQIRTTIQAEHIRPVTNVSFNISIGTVVPRTIEFHALPTEIVTIEPSWRGFEFFLVGDEIVIVDPATLRIVAVMPA